MTTTPSYTDEQVIAFTEALKRRGHSSLAEMLASVHDDRQRLQAEVDAMRWTPQQMDVTGEWQAGWNGCIATIEAYRAQQNETKCHEDVPAECSDDPKVRKAYADGYDVGFAHGMRSAIPDGWVKVPKEPTEAMLDEGIARCEKTAIKHMRARWLAMISVAQETKNETKETGHGDDD
jgi:hypothetical protein